MKIPVAGLVLAPSIGPVIVTVLGIDVPVLAMVMSMAGLLLARFIGPPPSRKLSRLQEISVTLLLMMLLGLIVTGELPPDSKPLGVGMATAWGVGMGLSGLMLLEFLGDRAMRAFKLFFGIGDDDDETR